MPQESDDEIEQPTRSKTKKKSTIEEDDNDVFEVEESENESDASQSESMSESEHEQDDTSCDICKSDVNLPTNRLVTCTQCGIYVHSECYGITEPATNDDIYLCDRCSEGITREVSCVLCSSTSGPVKRANTSAGFDGCWVHIACAAW
jgi:hypothetical protein